MTKTPRTKSKVNITDYRAYARANLRSKPTRPPTESRADVQESLSNNEEKHAEEKHAALSPPHPKQLPTNPYARRSESSTRDYPDEISMSTQEWDLNVSRLVGETNDGVPHSPCVN